MAPVTLDKKFYELCSSKVDYYPSSGVFKWRGTGKVCESKDVQGYLRIKVAKQTMKLHRLAWFMVYKEVPPILDHIDRDKTNNKLSNLRVATQKENCRNRESVGATSSYKGVCFRKTDSKFVARILVDGRREFLGCFNNEIDAAIAYDKRAIEVFKDFAAINFEVKN